MQELIILIGLPGSGKTTWAKNRTESCSNTVWISSDDIRRQLYGNEAIQGNPNTVFNTMHQRVREALAEGLNVIYDATNINRKSRKAIIKIGKAFTDVSVHGQIIWAPIDTCVQRDSHRSRSVGIEVIDKMIRRWESPYFDEGFNSISLSVTDNFDVEAYREQLIAAMKIPHDNPHHSLTIYEHCQAAYEYIKYSDTLDPIEGLAMRYHDCGKPYTKFFKADDPAHAHYYNHDNVGGYFVYGLSDSLTTSEALLLSWLVCNHMQPFFNSSYYKQLPNCLKTMIDEIHAADVKAH